MNFKPQIIENRYATMLVLVHECAICHRWMVQKPTDQRPFPILGEDDFEQQLKNGGLVIQSHIQVDGDSICVDCKPKAWITCYLCDVKQSADQEQMNFGHPNVDYLCKNCYATVPAKRWAELVEKLTNEHKYDYE